MIYLDYNASHPIRDSALKALASALTMYGNPSSIHGCGRKARNLVDDARRTICQRLGADQAIFTSSGTEANNLVLKNFENVAISSVEHDSVAMAMSNPTIIPVDNLGQVDVNSLQEIADDMPKGTLFSICLANNETGVIQPISEISKIIRPLGHLLHTDASQAIGRINVDMRELDADFMTISSHKFGGPMGVGALLIRGNHQLSPILNGGGQEFGMRSGSLPFSLIHGMSQGLVEALSEMGNLKAIANLRDHMEEKLSSFAVIHGNDSKRLCNTSCISMPGVSSESQVIDFDLNGIALSAGSACSSGKVKKSKTLTAMGLDDDLASSAIRVSIGCKTTTQEIDTFIENWLDIRKRHKE